MELIKRISLTVSGYGLKVSSPINLYVKDSLKLIFTINEYGIDLVNGIKARKLMPIEPLQCIMYVETPSGVDTLENTYIEGNEVHFELLPRHTSEVGEYKLQLVLLASGGHKVTLPEFTYEVRKSIYLGDLIIEPEEDLPYLMTNNGECLLTNDGHYLLYD